MTTFEIQQCLMYNPMGLYDFFFFFEGLCTRGLYTKIFIMHFNPQNDFPVLFQGRRGRLFLRGIFFFGSQKSVVIYQRRLCIRHYSTVYVLRQTELHNLLSICCKYATLQGSKICVWSIKQNKIISGSTCLFVSKFTTVRFQK